ncbi:MAG: transporter permease [Bacilli bacterium]|nr:transporter permease [Bacilli bacterium]
MPDKLSKSLIWVMAVACGLAVANIYYNQPLLADIGRSFHTTVERVGLVSMCTQIGYAIGMFCFVPLGDMKERRNLISILLIVVSLCLIGVATARNLLWMDLASFAVGITTVVPQIIVPLAAGLAEPRERGKVIGTVMSGLLIGILLARTVSGFVGQSFGWRSMYWIAASFMVGLGILLRMVLPKSYPDSVLSYGQLIKSIGQLILQERTLREAALIGAMQFGGFSVFWTSLTFFIERPPYHYGSSVAGLFGLVGVVGASAAPIAGRLADRFGPKKLVGFAIGITIASYMCFWLFGTQIWGLIAGVILLDMGVQGGQILNQTRIYSLIPEARSRLNTVYMVTSFLGGSLGSALGSWAWHLKEWNGVCAMGMLMIFLGFIVWGYHRIKERLILSQNRSDVSESEEV